MARHVPCGLRGVRLPFGLPVRKRRLLPERYEPTAHVVEKLRLSCVVQNLRDVYETSWKDRVPHNHDGCGRKWASRMI